MLSECVDSLRSYREWLAAFEPSGLSGADCASVAEELAALAKACAGAAARAAARAADCGAHQARGYKHADDWVARTNGTSRRDAKDALDAGAAISSGKCPGVRRALEDGRLSLAQAAEITRTEEKAPGSETELLAVALTRPLDTLRDEARKRRQANVDPAKLARRQHASRNVHHWRDSEGMVRMSAALPPIVGVPVMNRLGAEADRIRRMARRAGSTEPRAAHCADALVKMLGGAGPSPAGDARETPSPVGVNGDGPGAGEAGGTSGTADANRVTSPRGARSDVVLVCDLEAFRRGHSHAGEVSQIVGGGPIPVSMVWDALRNDAFLKAVIHDGVRIDTVVHYGRHIRAELRTALELGKPPDFDGVTCADGCGRRFNLQWDHVDPLANHGPTSFDNLVNSKAHLGSFPPGSPRRPSPLPGLGRRRLRQRHDRVLSGRMQT